MLLFGYGTDTELGDYWLLNIGKTFHDIQCFQNHCFISAGELHVEKKDIED